MALWSTNGEALVRFLTVLDSLMFVHKVLSRTCRLVHWKEGGRVEVLVSPVCVSVCLSVPVSFIVVARRRS